MEAKDLFKGAFKDAIVIEVINSNGYIQFFYRYYRGRKFFVRIMNDSIIHGEIVMRKETEVTYPSSISIDSLKYLIEHYKEVKVIN